MPMPSLMVASLPRRWRGVRRLSSISSELMMHGSTWWPRLVDGHGPFGKNTYRTSIVGGLMQEFRFSAHLPENRSGGPSPGRAYDRPSAPVRGSLTRSYSRNSLLGGRHRGRDAVAIQCRRIRAPATTAPEFFRRRRRRREGACVDRFKGHEQGSRSRRRVDAGDELPYLFAAGDERFAA